MAQVGDSFIDRHTRAKGEHQDRDHEAPEVDFLAVPEREMLVGGLARLAQAIEQQHLVAGIHQ